MSLIHLIFDGYLIYLLIKSNSTTRNSAKHLKKAKHNYFTGSSSSYDSGYMDGEMDGAIDQEILDRKIYKDSDLF